MTRTLDSEQTRRSQTINILRGAAAIAVCLFHFNEPYPTLDDPYHQLVQLGWLGVPVFFVISGFCISGAAERDAFGPYFVRRLLRIYPPYWASVILVMLLITIRWISFGVNDYIEFPTSVTGWIWTVLAITEPASEIPAINWVYWSIAYELAFYLLLGFATARTSPLLIIGVTIIPLITSTFPFDNWGMFASGVGCHWIVTGRVRSGLILFTLVALSITGQPIGLPQAATMISIAVIIVPPPKWITGPLSPLGRAGNYSYSLYLIHVPIGCFLLSKFVNQMLGRESFIATVTGDVILLAACLGFAWGFFRLIEAPSHDFARKLARQKRLFSGESERQLKTK